VQLYITTAVDKSQKWDNGSKENGFEFMVTQASDSSASRPYSTILQSHLVEVREGRPDLKSLISKEVNEATGKISINGTIHYFTHLPTLSLMYL